MKKVLVTVSLSACSLLAFAQAEFDALRLSQTDIAGTARFVGMSGAFGALGGDMSAVNVNPAGMGVFRSSSFSITPCVSNDVTKSDFYGAASQVQKMKLLMNNFGLIANLVNHESSVLAGLNFGVTYNRTADFNRNTSIAGYGSGRSFLDYVCNLENSMWKNDGTHPMHSNWYNYAQPTGAIFLNQTADSYVNPLYDGEYIDPSMELEESGGISAWNLSLGANFSHAVYLGVGLGVHKVNYERTSSYFESYERGGWMEMRNALTTTGTGYEFRTGLIFRPTSEMRLGVSYRSGTYFSLTDVSQASMATSGFTTEDKAHFAGAETATDYMLKTPWQLTVSGAYVLKEAGILSMDVDYTNNRSMQLKNERGFPLSEFNNSISNLFQKTLAVRLGAELMTFDDLSIRFGGAYYTAPVSNGLENNNVYANTTRPDFSAQRESMYASFGIGYHSGNLFVDLAVQDKLSKERFYNYYQKGVDTDRAYLNRERTSVLFTVGQKF
jgi:hypothetical protein